MAETASPIVPKYVGPVIDPSVTLIGYADQMADRGGKRMMTDAESTKLGGVQAGAQVNSITSVAGRTGDVTVAKSDIGLGNADNTSDANKPVSTAQQAALNAKAPLASPALTGTPTAPTAAPGNNSTQIATTAFVQAIINALINGAPGALDALNELAAAIGNDPSFATTMATALGNRVRVDTALQGLSDPQKANARANIGLATALLAGASIDSLVETATAKIMTAAERERVASLKKSGSEGNGGKVYRIRWGIRELASYLPGRGWLFQKLRLQASDTVVDDAPGTLLKDRIGRPTGPEIGVLARLRVGKRLIYDVTLLRGLYPRRMTIPKAAPIDDDLTLGISDRLARLVPGRRTGPELGSIFRLTVGKRLLADYSPARGLYLRKMTIPADARVDDDLATPLSERLSGLINGGFSGPDICQIGDSLTQQMGSLLATATGRTVHNRGYGGEQSSTIFARAGTNPFLATPVGGAIPASGSVQLTLVTNDGVAVGSFPAGAGVHGLNPCFFAGIEGSVAISGSTVTFTRAAAGSAVNIPFPRPLVTDNYVNRRGDIAVIEAVQNGSQDVEEIIPRINGYIAAMNRPVNRYVVCGFTTSSLSYRATSHARMRKEYGRRMINVLEWLSSYAALAHAGITPTTDDDAAIANGTLPPSFWASTVDSTHMNTAGYTTKAFYIAVRLNELGYI